MKQPGLSHSGWLFLLAAFFLVHFSFAQQLTPAQWDAAKKQGSLDAKAKATILVSDSLPFVARIAPNVPVNPATSSCTCWQPRDASFSVVPFAGYLGPDYRNDDGYSNVIALPFSFCLYGQSWNAVYINNNGNVSFGAPYSTFTASGFPNASFEMVAPFWGDVDTRGAGSGLVYYKITPTYMIVQWDSVGYYNSHTNLRNTFQLIITNGSDPIIPSGNVSFCYKDMQWTTGDASSGSGGFGGYDAVVGANRGDGINYIQFGTFNQPGGVYNGPNGPNSGIDWLDNQSFTFDACTNNNNIPPTPAGLSACDTLHICQGDTLPMNAQFFAPEVGQNTTLSINSTGVNGYTVVSNTTGPTADLISYFVGQSNNLGYNTITYTATDNGTPSATTIIVVVIQVTASPTSSATSTAATCSASNGSATVTASGGSGTYTYSWSPSGGTGANATGLGAGTYTCTITDAVTGCDTRQTVVIASSGSVAITPSSTNITCFGGTGSATVSGSGGTLPYTYAWSPTGGNGPTASNLTAGNYTCTVTDANGCVSTQSFAITQPPALTATPSQTNILCNGGNNGSASVNVTGGSPSYTYAWSPSGGTNASATALAANNYTCTITDAGGCSTTQSFAITQPPALTALIYITGTSCQGDTATAAGFGGVGPYSYQWSNFSSYPVQYNLTSGNYSVVVTDANGCTTTQSVTITAPPPLAASTSWNNIYCYGDSAGSAGVVASGGTPSYTYAWTPMGGNGSSATGLPAGTYTCTITDGLGCIAQRVFTLTQPTQVVATSSQTNILCNGASTGSTTVNVSGGVPTYTYAWLPSGGTNATANNLAANTYTCTITDANGCVSTHTVAITQPTALSSPVSVVNAGCFGPGSATANVSGGTPGYTYSWAPTGGTNATENNLSAGTYTVTVTDANGCTITQTASITQAPPVSATSSSTNATCFGTQTGTGNVVPSGGTSPFTYNWSPTGGNNATATGLAAGTYTCVITDANGCTATQVVTVTQPPQLTANTSHTNVICNGQTNGTATALPGGGTPGYTYSWSPAGGTNVTTSGIGAGTYTVTVTDANGCTATQTVAVTQPSPVTVSMLSDSVCLGGSVQIGASGGGGILPYTYAWSNGPSSSTQNVSPNATTSYTVTITDANGCATTGTSTAYINPLPVAGITSNAINGVYVINPNMGLCFTGSTTGVTAWNWLLQSGTSTDQSPCVTLTAADTGSFCAALEVTNVHGCTDTTSVCIIVEDVHFSIPNVFTPNSDGTNDAFIITNVGLQSLNCKIYDRWGVMVYQWDSPTGYWDGKTKGGDEAVDGVYYWTADLIDYSGTAHPMSGFVHLIRGLKQ